MRLRSGRANSLGTNALAVCAIEVYGKLYAV
jgi:hypothetical protein